MRGPRAPKTVGPGMCKVTVRITFPTGEDVWKAGVTDIDKVGYLSWKYARSLVAGWRSSLVDMEPEPNLATLEQQLLKELNVTGSEPGMDRWGKGLRGSKGDPGPPVFGNG